MKFENIGIDCPEIPTTCFIGDIHGCYDELVELVDEVNRLYDNRVQFFSVGDLFDRGPHNYKVFEWFEKTQTRFVMGNHDDKLRRYCLGNNVKLKPELEQTIEDLSCNTPAGRKRVLQLLNEAPKRYLYDNIQVVHAEPSVPMHGSKRKFEDVELSFNWWDRWDGKLTIFGHYWFDQPEIVVRNNRFVAAGIDTSCCAGGSLTGLVLPTGDLISIPAKKKYVNKCDSRTTLVETEKAAWKYWKENPEV